MYSGNAKLNTSAEIIKLNDINDYLSTDIAITDLFKAHVDADPLEVKTNGFRQLELFCPLQVHQKSGVWSFTQFGYINYCIRVLGAVKRPQKNIYPSSSEDCASRTDVTDTRLAGHRIRRNNGSS